MGNQSISYIVLAVLFLIATLFSALLGNGSGITILNATLCVIFIYLAVREHFKSL